MQGHHTATIVKNLLTKFDSKILFQNIFIEMHLGIIEGLPLHSHTFHSPWESVWAMSYDNFILNMFSLFYPNLVNEPKVKGLSIID